MKFSCSLHISSYAQLENTLMIENRISLIIITLHVNERWLQLQYLYFPKNCWLEFMHIIVTKNIEANSAKGMV